MKERGQIPLTSLWSCSSAWREASSSMSSRLSICFLISRSLSFRCSGPSWRALEIASWNMGWIYRKKLTTTMRNLVRITKTYLITLLFLLVAELASCTTRAWELGYAVVSINSSHSVKAFFAWGSRIPSNFKVVLNCRYWVLIGCCSYLGTSTSLGIRSVWNPRRSTLGLARSSITVGLCHFWIRRITGSLLREDDAM